MLKNVVVLGSTGSIGRSVIEVLGKLPDRFRVRGLSAHRNIEEFRRQCALMRSSIVAITDERACGEFLRNGRPDCVEKVFSGTGGLIELAKLPGVDIVVNALVGGVGLVPTIEALRAGKRVALANKESLVMAGDIILEMVKSGLGELIPVDSEHSAMFQLLDGKPRDTVRRVILTASGGPFRDIMPEMLGSVSVEDALKHPTWDMGRKITVDSATLANKGLEVIEAHHLFGIDYERIHVLVHPQSIVHSIVEFVDGSLWAHMSKPDMRIPIQYALTFPERVPMDFSLRESLAPLSLGFEEVRNDLFPTLGYAYEAGRKGGTAPVAFNAANEVAVEKFLGREISFSEIPSFINWALAHHPYSKSPDLEGVLAVDTWTREKTRLLKKEDYQ
jgi:1-deoxy-D-xylulose-5-phosphate reductoisomerase